MKTFGIFCGGYSSEFEISIKSATTIQKNFPKNWDVVKIIVDRDDWQVELSTGLVSLNRNNMTFITDNVETKIDAALIYTHGNPGENGKIGALLDINNIPYLNSSVLSSALSFDKWFCNQFLSSFGINVAKSILIIDKSELNIKSIKNKLGFPVVVKPTDSGSSFGVSKVNSENGLEKAVDMAFNEGDSVVIEEFLIGKEVTCGVYRTIDGLVALPLTEIVSENEILDYEAKYLGKSTDYTPARISDELTQIIQQESKKIYQLLKLKSIIRIDFMLCETGPYVIEINTTPGFSPQSVVPAMLEYANIPLEKFWTDIIQSELKF
jgi:D-alanine-D-alanine ligase